MLVACGNLGAAKKNGSNFPAEIPTLVHEWSKWCCGQQPWTKDRAPNVCTAGQWTELGILGSTISKKQCNPPLKRACAIGHRSRCNTWDTDTEKNHTSVDPKLGQHSNERADKWAHKRQAKEKGNSQQERSRDKWKTNVNGGGWTPPN